jgi:flavorubredoxin
MHTQITRGLYWIQECVSAADLDTIQGAASTSGWYEKGCEVHGANNGYLIDGEQSLLFDTGSPEAIDQFLADVEAVLEGDPLDYVAISHHELPHAGNVDTLLDRYPDAELLGPARGVLHDLHGLADATLVEPGDTLNLGGYTVEFLEPVLYDTAIHMWLYEHTTDMLCTVDWLACPHLDSECGEPMENLHGTDARLVMGNGATLPWLEFVSTDKTDAAIDDILAEYQPSILAPSHGPVRTVNATKFLRESKSIVDDITEGGATSVGPGV